MLIDNQKAIIERISRGDKTAFSFVFSTYYSDLVLFASSFTKDIIASEEIVQEVFVRFWETRDALTNVTSIKSFLLKSVQNKCIDRIRHFKIRERFKISTLYNPILTENDTENYVLHSELETAIKNAIEQLPKDVGLAFHMSRFENLKYSEIAQKMNVSVRTVEDRVSKALKMLKEHLKDYLVFIPIIGNFLIK